MEVIEISKKDILLLLDREEVIKYKLNDESAVFRDCFQRLTFDCGLGGDFLSDVLVQIFDSKSGGLQMFVTKLEESQSPTDHHNPCNKMFVYMFSDVSNLTMACKMLSDNLHTGYASAYYDSQKKDYYLMLDRDNPYISEFMGKRCKDTAAEYLSEYCKRISDNAVENLSMLA